MRPAAVRTATLALAWLLSACVHQRQLSTPQPTWIDLFDGSSLAGWQVTDFGGQGLVELDGGALRLHPGSPLTGIDFPAFAPGDTYELEVAAARLDGNDFFCGLTFPVGAGHLTLVLGGWGGSVCGLSSLDGEDASSNATRTVRSFANGVEHTIHLAISPTSVSVTLDGTPLLGSDLSGRSLSLRPEVDLSRPLGICCYSTTARLRSVRWRPQHGARKTAKRKNPWSRSGTQPAAGEPQGRLPPLPRPTPAGAPVAGLSHPRT
jgi:hypothetical protein